MEGTLQAQKSHQQRVGILKNVMPTFIIFPWYPVPRYYTNFFKNKIGTILYQAYNLRLLPHT
jgi:hypothetical protein